MPDKILRMKLLSELCPASGDGFAGFVDTDVCFDDLGLPYIPAKRVKGCLRECGLDIVSADANYGETFSTLFGEAGKSVSGTLNIENGMLANYNKIAEALGSATRSEIAEVYTSIRSRTKMENGKVATGTLRTTRVLNKGQVYEFPVSFSDNHDEQKLFEMCVKSLRNIGINRSRGLGEVECTIENIKENTKTQQFNINHALDKSGFSYMLELTEPVISSERSGIPHETESYIFGSAVLGAFAVKYIEKKGLPRDAADKDWDFRRIFLEGGVKFTAAMPSADGLTFYPSPTVLRTDKLRMRLFDESLEVSEDSEGEGALKPICKRLGGFISVDIDGKVKTFNPEKTTFLHHARPLDRSVAHATENDGKLYSYEALSAGQSFAGSVIGNSDDIRELAGLFADSNVLRVGRSRTAQYGKVEIVPSKNAYANDLLSLKSGGYFRLVAVTPIILEDKNGVNKTDIRLIADILGADYEITRTICSETVVSGYNSKWLLPRRQERAIAEGSTIVFKYNGDGTTLNLDFIGKRTGEGFGQVRVESVPLADAYSLADENKATVDTNATTITEIKELRMSKHAVAKGIEYGELSFATAPQNANLTRILVALKKATNFNGFAQLLEDIKQPQQKIAAFAFATGKTKQHFMIDPKNLEAEHITHLLKKVADKCELEDKFNLYRKYLNAAAQRIKEKRRSGERKELGGDNA